jgi:glycosyltransferase involved in cell wall biosynthesis
VALVACLVPAYNHAAYVADAVESAAGPDVEVIAVDDASADGTWEVLRSLERPGVRVLRNERNLGAVGTVLRAYAESSAPYVTVLASDDRWLPGRAARQAAVLDAGAEWSFGQAMVVDGGGARVSEEPQGPPPDADGMLRTLLRGQGIYAPTLMFRRSLFDRSEPAQALWEDLVITLRFAAMAEPAYVAEPLVEYRVHGANVHLDLLERGLHIAAHVEAVTALATWGALPYEARAVVGEHLKVWQALAALKEGRVALRGLSRDALDGVVARQARDLVREVDGGVLRRFEAALLLRGARRGAAAIGEVRGGPLVRRVLRRAAKR